jgi:LysR family glycine cleavage system transcriptional activator
MPSYIPDIQLLRAFLAVASELSFTRAGAKLNQTQSAVSHQIRKLETQLDMSLFVRHSSQVMITEAGAALQLRLQPLIEQLDTLFATGAARKERSKLEVELETGFATFWLTPRFSRFIEGHPDIEITMNVSHRRLEFVGNTELAVKWGDGDWPGCIAERLMDHSLTPMCSPALARKLNSLEDLAQKTLLHERNQDLWARWFAGAGFPDLVPPGGHVYQDTAMLRHAAIQGHGVALFATELATDAIEKGELVLPFPDTFMPTTNAYYVITKSRRLSHAANSFVRWLKAEADLMAEVRLLDVSGALA